CGGGQTPHGWLACEETRDPGHGWVFLCDPAADGLREPVRIGAYGRMRHEAAVLDASSGRAWLTEDEPDGCLYRYVPDDPTEPFGPGRLQALAVDGLTDTTPLATGTVLDVSWVDLPPTDGTLRSEAAGLGAARFARGEGAWLRDGRLVFTATSGGPALAGQIFALDVESDVLTVLYASADLDDLLRPDNLTILADGRVVVCEDHGCPCRLHVLGSDGSLTPIARSVLEGDELAGVCPSPDGRVLFVNLYRTGVTLAIMGL
ncbi:MAG: DUF839 domain-containing protein, partial [Myxococcales bacterium]|nr:DUF839 domain-containing protein [Myxococcales bacterium]